MPLQNRVTPEGEIIATPHRGLMMGNRGGAFHLPDQTLGPRRWATRQWIACVLEFKGRHREIMQPNRYTELFFLDEATALAAGHRPCFECRRADAERFAELWAKAHGQRRAARAPAMDEVLHAERLGRRPQQAHVSRPGSATCRAAPSCATPSRRRDGARPISLSAISFWPGPRPATRRWCRRSAPAEEVEVLTPRSIVAVLSAGYRPMLHPSAAALLG